jgi:rhodanese-related sulfurtransferase
MFHLRFQPTETAELTSMPFCSHFRGVRCVFAVPALRLIAAALVAAIALSGCGGTPKVSGRNLVFVDAEEAARVIQGQRGPLGIGGTSPGAWIDPRPIEEYRAARIPGAIHLPLDRVREDHRALNGYGVLVVYGGDYNSSRAEAMSKTLLELGYKDVRILRGGLRAWRDAGNPVEGEQRGG